MAELGGQPMALPRSMGAWEHGSMGAWEHGSMGAWEDAIFLPSHPPNRRHVNMQPFPRSHGIVG